MESNKQRPPGAPAQASRRAAVSIARAQVAIWVAVAVLYFGFDQGRSPSYVTLLPLLARAAVWSFAGLSISTLLIVAHARMRTHARPLRSAIPIALAASILGGLAWLQLFNVVDGVFGLEPGWRALTDWSREAVYVEWMDSTLMLLVWHGALFSFVQLERSNRQREQALALRQATTEAHLIALRAQVNPHFLFNALNSAMELVHQDAARAEAVLQGLADILRYSLTQTRDLVPLRDEIALVRDYLAIERVRFESQLRVRWDIDPRVESVAVPAGVLLPLVDNAIKHGVAPPDGALALSIVAHGDTGTLRLSITNTGALAETPHPRSLALGLANVRNRLDAQYGTAASLRLTAEDDEVVAHLELPRRSTET